jgi:hypothetical protein
MEAPIASTAADTQAAPVFTKDTSAQALEQIGWRKMAAQQREVFDIVLACQRNGQQDMSLTEIRDTYERVHGKRIDLNRVSARVSDLIAAKRLQRKEDTRACSVSGKNIHPVFVPPHQARLFA